MILAKVPESETKSSSEETGSNKMPVLIPWEEHQKLLNEAAKRASQETLESFRKLDKTVISDRESNRSGDTGLEGDDDDEIDFFASKTNKSIKNMVSSVATLKRAFEQPPSQIEQAMYQAFTQKTIDSLSGASEKKKNWYDEILSSLAHGVGQRGPELIESLTRNFGSEWVKQTATGLLNPGAVINNGGPGGGYGGQSGMGGQSGQGQNNRGVGGNSNLNQDAVNQIMALDPNNPEHVSAYAEIQGNIDINDARKMLQIHQDIFMNKMKRNVAQTGDVGGAGNTGIPPNVPVNTSANLNSDIPPVWAQAMMGKIIELENKVNSVYAGGVGGVETIESVRTVSHADRGVGKVQTAAEFQMELEEELRRDKEKLDKRVNGNVSGNASNVNKWEDDPGTAVGIVSHERRLEEEQMRKKPLHDASADMIRREVDNQKEKLDVVTTVENFEEEKVEEVVVIPEDINSDIDKIVAEEVKEEDNIEEDNVKSEPLSIPNLEIVGKVKSKFQKGSQGWLKEQKELKEKR
jgi:hypothetical protein